MSVLTRFAPSPTGRLHVGNARTALIAWLFARHASGRFVLRIDDTDGERADAALVRAIEHDLRWLGIDWDEQVQQSARTRVYEAAFAQLERRGRVYPCYETADELAEKRRVLRAQGLPPVYDRAGRALGSADRHAYQAEGRSPHHRFALHDGDVAWSDLIQGEKRFHTRNLSDPVIRRADGTFTYPFASAVDDLEFAISDVIRGEDHVTNTAVQIALIEALAGAPPRFGHLPLLVDTAGQGLSKRLGSLTLEALRAKGIEPRAVAGFLAALGTSLAPRPDLGLAVLVQTFHLEAYGRAPPRFEEEALARFNADVLHALPFVEAQPRLEALGIGAVDRGFYEVIRPNLEHLSDLVTWWAICHRPLMPVIEDPEFLAEALDRLPAGPLDADAAARWLDDLKEATGRRGKALYRPLRLALSGREHGPPLAQLATLIGRTRVVARLRGEIS